MRIAIVALAGALSCSLLVSAASADSVNIGINIGVPPPPVIIASPPKIVVVPGTPVYYAPAAAQNIFVYKGRYYTLHDGHWFHAVKVGAPWVVVAHDKVPKHVLGVPHKYYKIPPGHAKKMDGDHPGRGHGRDWDDDEGRGRGHGKHDKHH